jgi:hypothetical protein
VAVAQPAHGAPPTRPRLGGGADAGRAAGGPGGVQCQPLGAHELHEQHRHQRDYGAPQHQPILPAIDGDDSAPHSDHAPIGATATARDNAPFGEAHSARDNTARQSPDAPAARWFCSHATGRIEPPPRWAGHRHEPNRSARRGDASVPSVGPAQRLVGFAGQFQRYEQQLGLAAVGILVEPFRGIVVLGFILHHALVGHIVVQFIRLEFIFRFRIDDPLLRPDRAADGATVSVAM